MAHPPQQGGGRGHVQRLVAELVGRDQENPHTARLPATRPTARRSRSRADRGRYATLLRPPRASRRGRRGSRGSGRPSGSGRTGRPRAIEISSPVTPGTARASSCPRTSRALLPSESAASSPRRRPSRGRVEGKPEGVAEDEFLEAHAQPEAQRPRAEPADRARSELEQPRSGAVDPELGVDRPRLSRRRRHRRSGGRSTRESQPAGARG